jgi:hypothetical protein
MWHADVAIEAARRGQGVALANPFLLGDDLSSGRLVNLVPPLAPDRGVTLGAYVLCARADSWQSPHVAQFRTWIKKAIASGQCGAGDRLRGQVVHTAAEDLPDEEEVPIELIGLPA